MEPMLSMGLNSPIRFDIPAATIRAPTFMEIPPSNCNKKQIANEYKYYDTIIRQNGENVKKK
jgi:hypothetical protein